MYNIYKNPTTNSKITIHYQNNMNSKSKITNINEILQFNFDNTIKDKGGTKQTYSYNSKIKI